MARDSIRLVGASCNSISIAEARRIAIAAQGLATTRPPAVDTRTLLAMVRRLGVVQLDSVNVLVRTQYLPAWSRLGAYDRGALDRLWQRAPRTLFEFWGHEASLLPVELHPLLRWRMARAHEHAWRHVREVGRKRKALVREVLAIVADKGPIAASDLELVANRIKKKGWWEWSNAKRAIEWLFWSGEVTCAHRRVFERMYDLPSRVLPARVLAMPTPREPDAQRELVAIAARALGVATETDLRDYFRLSPAPARAAIAALVEAGTLAPVTVDGWKHVAYLERGAMRGIPRVIDRDRAALLSPFDSLVWARERTERLFAMRYRIEIYVPPGKRVHGYYVLPFLLGDRLVARVDLKADRMAGALRVQAAHVEAHSEPRAVVEPLARELVAMAAWLGLPRVEVVPRGELAAALARAL
jgi:uncharacterized protein YcaQ